jgi:hypothetical protein
MGVVVEIVEQGAGDLLDAVTKSVDRPWGNTRDTRRRNRACSGGSTTSSDGGSRPLSTPGLVFASIR